MTTNGVVTRALPVVLLLAPFTAVGCSGSGHPGAGATTSTSTSPRACRDRVVNGPLPDYARGGFQPPDRAVEHVTGSRGRIVGIVFGAPLTAVRASTTSPTGHVNKIRWEARSDGGGGDLRIRASLAGTRTTVERRVAGGPGSSVIDLPAAGCWRLALSWGHEHDAVDLVYRSG